MTQESKSFIALPHPQSKPNFGNDYISDVIEKNLSCAVILTLEDNYWRQNFWLCDYVGHNETYETYQAAYLHGVRSFLKYDGCPFAQIESHIANAWFAASNRKTLPWIKAKYAVHAAYQRLLLEQPNIDASMANFFGVNQFENSVL